MENKKEISDELLAKYLSGQCTEAEESDLPISNFNQEI